jgi:phospholipase A-2-activating protein
VRAISILPVRSQGSSSSTPESLPPFYDNESLFVTASNDGTLRVWSLDDRRSPPHTPTSGGEALRVLRSEETSDLLYDVKFAGVLQGSSDRIVISCGEDGLLRGWNVEDGSIVLSIPQPVTSVWSLAILPISGDLVTANSDGKVRVFTQRIATIATEKVDEAIGEVSEEDLNKHKKLCDEVGAKKRRG